MKSTLAIFAAALVCASVAFGQPSLRAANPAGNGASYGTDIAQGSIFVVFGLNIGAAGLTQATSLPLQTTMAGTSMRFAPVSGGAAVDALMVYTTQNQIAGLLPSSAAPGDYNLTVTFNGQTSAPGRVKVVDRAFGIVSADASGTGQAQVQNYRTATDWDLNRFAKGNLASFTTSPATPGQVLVIWGTGLGADAQSDLNGGTSGDRTSAANVRVLIGSKEIVPAYAGRASALPGTDQINITLPADVDLGCTVTLQVRVGSTLSNAVTLAIARSGDDSCSHPFLPGDALRRISEGGTVTMGAFSLTKQSFSISVPGFPAIDTTSENIGGSFARYGAGNLNTFAGLNPPVGTCQVLRVRGGQNDLLVTPVPVTPLDAGAQLTLNGPNASNIAVPRGANKVYAKALSTPGIPGIPGLPGGGGGSAVISAGTYTLSGTGGDDIGAFSASVTVPSPLNWTNRDSINSVPRSSNLNLTWSGGGSDVVEIFGASGTRVGGTDQNPIFDFGVFICFANASAGSFTVSSSILSQLPASTGDITSGNSIGLLGLQLVGTGTNGRFTAPLKAGGNIDFGVFTFTNGSNKTVTYP